MGHLVYGQKAEYEVEDRALAHLRVAIVAKLRLREGFLLNWTIPAAQGSGRVSLWIAPGIPLEFRFSGSKPPELDRTWIDALSRSSHGARGMVLMDESEAAGYIRAAGAPSAL